MKRILKKLPVLLSVLCLLAVMTACGKEVAVVEYDETVVKSTVRTFVDMFATMNEEMIDSIEKSYSPEDLETSLKNIGLYSDGEGFLAAARSFYTAREELGEVDSHSIPDEDIVISADADEVTATVSVKGTGLDDNGKPRTADIEFIFDSRMKLTSSVTNIDRSFGENMRNAGLNTLLGMGTVFVVLILIALVIYCFKYISVIEKSIQDKKRAPKERAEAIDNALGQIEKYEQRDDTELVAVIAAAIAAFEESRGGSSDGYVVRSIKRVK